MSSKATPTAALLCSPSELLGCAPAGSWPAVMGQHSGALCVFRWPAGTVRELHVIALQEAAVHDDLLQPTTSLAFKLYIYIYRKFSCIH